MVRGILGMIVTGMAVTAVSFLLRPRRRRWFQFGMNTRRLPFLRNMMNMGRLLTKVAR
ncbi:hypothetical protein LOK74_12905 [Brevibacillus humidisoli]|uniref:hypothetical protein n=1 Tax=Brevibacillus humidisoli TaxID=2895522 RepID=UPI001E56B8F5|nr:hypothetical protein [Brevibacillus humidisoli]UFJ38981.1 hypothetical protein LOK74_12905 [Brevibacillus humidisoli]